MKEANLDGDLSTVNFVPYVAPKHGVYFNGPGFWSMIDSRGFDRLDIITYSTGQCPTSTKIDRLIVGSPGRKFERKAIPRTMSGHKVYANLHSKLVLAWMHGGSTPSLVAVGSLNLCDSESGELMLTVQSWQQEQYLCKYFNELWDNPGVKPNK